jgi:hypothetical protein
MKFFRSLFLAIALLPAVASAHQDRILTIRKDGSIPEIPASFGPVFLNISGLGGTKPSISFKTGTHITELPACVTRYVRSKSHSDLFVVGSWYHQESVLPYYVSVQFLDPGHDKNRSYNSSTNILFNLHNGTIIHVKRFVANRSGSGGKYTELELPEGCLPQASAV